ncbi:MAG: hypothetical protein GY842_24955 [bacterium]|nr:hypothetical protein [bacterium]
MKARTRVPVYLLFLGVAAGGVAAADPDPGLILEVNGQPKPASFTLPAGSSYYFEYPAAVSLWDTAAKDNLIVPGQVLTAPPAIGDADGDGDFDLEDFAALQRCFTGDGGGPIGPECGAFDVDGDDDVDLIDFGAGHASFAGPFTPLLGDLDASGTVDLGDHAAWSACLDGPLVILAADSDQDGDVDLSDFVLWAACLSGPAAEPPGGCTQHDLTGDGWVDLADFGAFQGLFTGPRTVPPGCADADLDDDGDVDLMDHAIFQTIFGDAHPVPDVDVTVWAEGLTPSATLGDVLIDLWSDPDGDQTFTLSSTQVATVVQITISPTTVSPGTAMVATLQPSGGSLVFDAATTVSWAGDYVPTFGPTVPVTITYAADEVLERSASECVLVTGAGTTDAPLSAFLSEGTLEGTFTFDLNGLQISGAQNIVVTEGLPNIYKIAYGGDMVPSVGLPVSALYVSPGPVPSEETMVVSVAYHHAAVVAIEKTPETLTGPSQRIVQVMSLNPALTVVQDYFSVTLTRLPDDTDPNYLLYASDLNYPLFPINVDVDRGQFTQVIPFETVDDGYVVGVGEGVTP